MNMKTKKDLAYRLFLKVPSSSLGDERPKLESTDTLSLQFATV